MTLGSNRYPYFLRSLAAFYAVAFVVCARSVAHAVPPALDPLGEGADELPFLVIPDAGPARPPEVIEGDVLVARPLTQETSAELTVALRAAEGFALLRLRSTVENRGAFPTPVDLQQPIADAVALEASCGAGCTATISGTPRGFRVHTSPELAPRATRTITLELAVATTRSGGNVRLSLPPRGGDTRASRLAVRIADAPSATVSGVAVGTEGVEISPFATARIAAREELARVAASMTETPNGTRLIVHLPTRAPSPKRITLLVDASPSTLGPARNATLRAVSTLLARLPQGSEASIVVFGATAERVLPRTAITGPLDASVLARLDDVAGTTTRLDRALELVEDDDVDRVIVLGDGGVTRVPADATAQRARRMKITYVLLGARGPSAALSELVARGHVELVDARSEGELAMTTRDDGPLADALLSALAPRIPVVVRDGRHVVLDTRAGPGDSLVWVARMAHPAVFVAGARIRPEVLSNALAARLPPVTRTLPSEPAPNGRDLPRETILEALRRQFIPPARLCLRTERRGRARHSIRAELVVRLAVREVTDVQVNGEIAPTLRACLGDALEHLVLAEAAAPMIVRYPIHTIEADVPPVLELDTETQQALDRSMGAPDAPR